MKQKTQPSLLQVLGLGTAILLVAGNIIGSGVFKKIAPMSASLMNENLIIWAWIVAGIITMLGALSYASLASVTKEAGGQFQYFKNVFNDFTGFMFGWSFFSVISTASIASISYVFAESFVKFWHIPDFFNFSSDAVRFFGLSFSENFTVKFIAIMTLVLLTIYNILGVKGGGWLSNIVTAAKILGILILIVLGLSFAGSDHTPVDEVIKSDGIDAQSIFKLSAFFTAMLGAFWAYDGWVNITNMASEFKNPTKNVPRAIIFGTLLTMILYVLVNFAYLNVLSPAEFAAISKQQGSIAAVEVANVVMGSAGIVIISALIMISTFGATQGSTMSAARVYYQMSREGLFFKPFARVNERFRTPHISLTGQMIWASILILSGTFDQLTDMLVFVAFLFYALGAVAVIKLKRSRPDIKTYGYPFVPVLFILFCIFIIGNSIYSRPWESLIGLGLVSTGVPLYFYFRSKLK
ncbi:MAG: amino acid permease [Saprospiraceae bacterium]|nr:amino acid permease [Saprospiraceae bacterium]